jgi:hypothetical protein
VKIKEKNDLYLSCLIDNFEVSNTQILRARLRPWLPILSALSPLFRLPLFFDSRSSYLLLLDESLISMISEYAAD